MALQTLKKRVLVRPLAADSETIGGIFIPLVARDRSAKPGELVQTRKGVVESIGLDVAEIFEGEVVLYTDYVGQDLSFNGIDYKLLHEEHILAIIDG